jgi:cell division protein FtsI/penicillin-binding protein 2
MRPGALRHAAEQLGVIADYAVDGLPTAAGSVPAASDLTVRTEDGFGQGRIVVTPFAMAVAAATVAHGSAAPAPYLIVGRPTAVRGERPTLDARVIDGLRAMMRQVVLAGTAQRIADQGAVYGKTGEAEYPGGSHAWFVGYRGDLAFATLVVDGGSSDTAVAVTREMFAGLPSGY